VSNAFKSSEYPESSGIKIRPKPNTKGKEVFGISYQVTVPEKVTGGKRARRQFETEDEAKRFAEELHKSSASKKEVLFQLTKDEQIDLLAVLPKLRQYRISIKDAVEFAIPRMNPEGGDKTINEVIEELRLSKEKKKARGAIRDHSIRSFVSRARGIQEAFDKMLMKDLTLSHVVEWISEMDGSNRTRKNYLTVLSEVISHSVARKYVRDNILDSLTSADRVELYGIEEEKEPEILSIEETERLIQAAHDRNDLNLLAAVTLGLFCGIRTEELQKLEWEDVRLSERFVKIGANVAKKRRIRNVTIPENALAWLSCCRKESGLIAEHESAFRNRFDNLLREAGFVDLEKQKLSNRQTPVLWKRNAMRHSFGSYHFALHGDSILTSNELGHSQGDAVLFNHYRALATKAKGKKYFGIMPAKSSRKVVGFNE